LLDSDRLATATGEKLSLGVDESEENRRKKGGVRVSGAIGDGRSDAQPRNATSVRDAVARSPRDRRLARFSGRVEEFHDRGEPMLARDGDGARALVESNVGFAADGFHLGFVEVEVVDERAEGIYAGELKRVSRCTQSVAA